MVYLIVLTGLIILLELGLWLPSKSPRRTLAALTLSLLLPSSLLLGAVYTNIYSLLFVIIASYRALNLWRFIGQRRHADHLYSVVKRTSSWLLSAQLLSLWLAVHSNQAVLGASFVGLLALMVGGCVIVSFAAERNLRKIKPSRLPENLSGENGPTLSVLIPARNETTDLEECLASLIKSTYPKLEIIVLDDCSQNQRTPEIIKGFAHDGVRFIAGGAPPENWLAKNYAYDQLAKNANGELLLFCGVDTRFKPETLAVMVNELVTKHKTMVSFVPTNRVPNWRQFESLLVQPSRYAWELLLPRRALDRPAVLSTAWLINHQTLKASGGFKSLARAATPERAIARYAATHNDGYSFVISDTEHGVSSVKGFSDQQATAIRTRYPQLHQSLELTALVSLIELVLFVFPLALYFDTVLQQRSTVFWLANFSATITIIVYCQICRLTYRRFLWRSLWLLPFAALYDIALLNYSMFKYEFKTVDWKGRNSCIPVMQVIKELPKI